MKNKPNSSLHNPCPDYLRELILRAGLTQKEAAESCGVAERTMRQYLNKEHASRAPYSVQYCLEALAKRESSRTQKI